MNGSAAPAKQSAPAYVLIATLVRQANEQALLSAERRAAVKFAPTPQAQQQFASQALEASMNATDLIVKAAALVLSAVNVALGSPVAFEGPPIPASPNEVVE